MNEEKIFFGQRIIFCRSLKADAALGVPSPFALLMPASDKEECAKLMMLVPAMLDAGCVEFCCVGSQAEFLHDDIDKEIEDRGLFEVTTTQHSDMADACEYFIFAAGGANISLMALILDYPNLMNELRVFLASF